MPRIEQKRLINAEVERVFGVARDIESFPRFMPDLQSLVVQERSEDGCRTVSEWVGIIREFKMTIKWVQEDVWDMETRRDQFRLLKGDLNRMEGHWQFTAQDGKTLFESVVDYEYNVPLIGPMIKALIHKKMVQNLDSMMKAIQQRAESIESDASK